jgi:N-methylhydantoinase A/oxoprolinase/acetone carboxylase beta subunit
MTKRLGIPKGIIPWVPDTHSPFALITSDIKHDEDNNGEKEPKAAKKVVQFEDIGQCVTCDAYTREKLPVGFGVKAPAIVFQKKSMKVKEKGKNRGVNAT